MKVGLEIISYALRNHTLSPFLHAGMTKAWLHSKEDGSAAIFPHEGQDREVYGWILEHHARHHKPPSLEIFRHEYPERTYRLTDSDYTASELTEIATREVQALVIAESADQMATLYDDGKIDKAVVVLRQANLKIRQGINDPQNWIELGDPEFDLEEFLNQTLDMGIPLGISAIDEQFYGWQPGQLITFLGRQKSTKTTLLLYSALQAWQVGDSAIVYSVEMAQEEIRNRVYAIGAAVSSEHLRRGELRTSETQRVRDFENKLRGDFGDVRFMISERGPMMTVDDIEADIERYHPHVIFIDGFYFMRDRISGESAGSDWRANENLAMELKALAKFWDIPVVVTTQVQEKQHNRKNKTIEGGTIMGGTGLLKASDLVLGFNKNPDDAKIMINGVLSRYSPIDTVCIEWDWERMVPEVVEFGDDDEDGGF